MRISYIKENLKAIGFRNLGGILLLVVMWKAVPILQSYLTKYMILTLEDHVWHDVLIIVIFMIGVWIFSTIMNAYEQNLRQLARTRSETNGAICIRKKLCNLPGSFFENANNIDLLRQAEDNCDIAYDIFLSLVGILISIPASLACVIPMISIIPEVVLAVVVLTLIHTCVGIKCSELDYLQYLRGMENERKRGYYKSIIYQPETEKEIKAFDAGEWLLSKYDCVSKNIFHEVNRRNRKNSIFILAANFFSLVVKIVYWIIVSIRVMDGRIGLSDGILFIGLWNSVYSLLDGIRGDAADAVQHIKKCKSVSAFFSINEDRARQKDVLEIDSIALSKVSFRYPGRRKNVLTDICATFYKGKCYLLLGENGAGKSTLIKLILKHYKPDNGEIIINGTIDIGQMQEPYVGYMEQDSIHYSLSVRDNIVFGREYDEKKLQEVLDRAGIREMIDALPDKENTLLGKNYEDGAELSGGQWQRISLARLLYSDSALIILDEPTARMDTIAEQKLYKKIKEIFWDRIVIIISHRLSSVNIADEIIVLSDGRIMGIGTHEDLMQTCKTYQILWKMDDSIRHEL